MAYTIFAKMRDVENPPITRTIVVPKNSTFDGLAHELIYYFGFEGYHMNEFEAETFRVCVDDDEFGDILDYLDESDEEYKRISKQVKYDPNTKLTKLLKKGSKCLFTYDFGDSWRIDLEVLELNDKVYENMPCCIEAVGASAVEDIGGLEDVRELARQFRTLNTDEEKEEFFETHNDFDRFFYEWAVTYDENKVEVEIEELKEVKKK